MAVAGAVQELFSGRFIIVASLGQREGFVSVLREDKVSSHPDRSGRLKTSRFGDVKTTSTRILSGSNCLCFVSFFDMPAGKAGQEVIPSPQEKTLSLMPRECYRPRKKFDTWQARYVKVLIWPMLQPSCLCRGLAPTK